MMFFVVIFRFASQIHFVCSSRREEVLIFERKFEPPYVGCYELFPECSSPGGPPFPIVAGAGPRRSADFQSAASRICNPQDLEIPKPLRDSTGPPNAIRRYGRVQLCATVAVVLGFHVHFSVRLFAGIFTGGRWSTPSRRVILWTKRTGWSSGAVNVADRKKSSRAFGRIIQHPPGTSISRPSGFESGPKACQRAIEG